MITAKISIDIGTPRILNKNRSGCKPEKKRIIACVNWLFSNVQNTSGLKFKL